MRVLAVDPGDRYIGVAISDQTGTIANPLTIIKHTSRLIDAATIAQIGQDNSAQLIIVGATYDEHGQLTAQGRRAARLADVIRSQTPLEVTLWDEDYSSQAALSSRIALGTSRKKRKQRLDDLAATYILQTYLDARHKNPGTTNG